MKRSAERVEQPWVGERAWNRWLDLLLELALALTRMVLGVRRRVAADDRGDVPGWVLVAVMTAGLVTAIWLVADGQLTSVFNRAVTSVTKP